MTLKLSQDHLNNLFIYKNDEYGDTWSIHKDFTKFHGDCEDYELTLMWFDSDRSWIKFWINVIFMKYVIWYARSPRDVGHAVLWIRGHGWTDNIQKKIVTKDELKSKGYKIKFPYILPLFVAKFLLKPVYKVIGKLK